MGETSDHRIVFPSVKYCLQDSAWHSFSQIFWPFEQTSRKYFWFLTLVSHLWRRVSSAACAMSLKYPSLPETYVACFPSCGKGYHFQSTKSSFSLCTHTSPSPALHLAGVKGNIILNCSAVTCQRGEDACAPNTLCCACFWKVLYSQSVHSGTREKQQVKAVLCRHIRAKSLLLSALLCRAVPGCASMLPTCTFGGALGQGAARLEEMPEELLSALSCRV